MVYLQQNKLKRHLVIESIHRLEEAARTLEDFENVMREWDKLDENRERKDRYHETSVTEASLNWRKGFDGDYLDVIFNGADEMWQLIADWDIAILVKALSVKQRDVLYLGAMWFYTNRQIAFVKRQSERNIRKLRALMLDNIRDKLAPRLRERSTSNKPPITTDERKFLKWYDEQTETEKSALDKSEDSE